MIKAKCKFTNNGLNHEVQQMDAGRLLEMEIILSVIDVGILAIVPEGAPNQTTGLYRLSLQ